MFCKGSGGGGGGGVYSRPHREESSRISSRSCLYPDLLTLKERGSSTTLLGEDGGFCGAPPQRSDGEAPPEDRAIQAAPQQLRDPL